MIILNIYRMTEEQKIFKRSEGISISTIEAAYKLGIEYHA